jgi:hypothetical protein
VERGHSPDAGRERVEELLTVRVEAAHFPVSSHQPLPAKAPLGTSKGGGAQMRAVPRLPKRKRSRVRPPAEVAERHNGVVET